MGSPARKAGIRAGDQILRVNGLSTEGRTVEDFDRVVRGVPGTEVQLTIKKSMNGEVVDVALVRSSVVQKNVPYHGMVKDGIGYIILTTFTMDASKNISSALKELKKEDPNLKGVILDLRSNGGGLLREAISVSNIFIDKGLEVVSTRGKVEDRDQTYRTFETPDDLDIPVAVLINKRSASASEIVSGVLQDYDRGVLIGQRSFGKGLVQNTVNVAYNNRVKLTTSKYYIPSRRCIQSVEYDNGEPVDIPDDRRSKFKTRNGRTVLDGGGVTPDIRMPEPKDSPLIKALKGQHVIFKYVNQYIVDKDSVTDLDSYVFNDYDSFVEYVKGTDFRYETETEKHLKKAENTIQDEFKSDGINPLIETLMGQINKEKEAAFTSQREDIVKEIETEIISRYFAQSGRIKFSLSKDEEVLEAVSVLNDPSRYQKILGY
jgi:carboxyl-terminal processing protease